MKLQTQKSFNQETIAEDAVLFKLSNLKPAGTQLLISPFTSDLADLLKLTLYDLAHKQVVVIKRKKHRMHPRDPYEREFIVIESGKNFLKYQPDSYEHYILDWLDNENFFYLKPLLKEAIDSIPGKFSFKTRIVKDLQLRPSFRFNLFFYAIMLLKLNKTGKAIQTNISSYLEALDNTLGDFIEQEPKKALEVLTLLQGNIFLLKNLKFELIEKLKVVSIDKTNSRWEDWIWTEFLLDSELLFSDLLFDINDIFEEIDVSFDFNDLSDWDVGFDFTID